MAHKRLVALDVLRGLTIALMILVNNPGSWEYVYPPLRHSDWNGCTPTDLVFPFFLFIVGTAMFYSFKKFENGLTKPILMKILKRFVQIFLIGVFLNAFPKFDFENLRVFGVMQRIAIAYLFGALIVVIFKYKQVLIAIPIILFGYWALIYFGGTGDVYSLETNIVRSFDIQLVGAKHLYQGFGVPFDPEGFLSAIPSVATVLFGYVAGNLIQKSLNTMDVIKKMAFYGIILVGLGLLWNMSFPINKPIWTSSYVLYTAGWAMLVLGMLLFVIDEKGIKKWSMPAIHFGTNPLFIYVFSWLYISTISFINVPSPDGGVISIYGYLYVHVCVPIAGNMNGSLLFAVGHIIFFWSICYYLYKKKIFIKI